MNLLNDVPNCITRIAKILRKWKIILLFWKIFHSSKCQTNKKCQGEKNQSLLLTALNPGRINIKSTIKRKHEINKQFKKNCYSGIHDGYTSTGSEANEHHNIKTQTENPPQKTRELYVQLPWTRNKLESVVSSGWLMSQRYL